MAELSKKHYQAIADAFRESMPRNPSSETVRYMRNASRDIADTLEATNPRFDRVRFLDACGFYRSEHDY